MADPRHKRDTNARPTPSLVKIAGPLAVLATLGSVAVGVVVSSPETRNAVTANQANFSGLVDSDRDPEVSRSAPRSRAKLDPDLLTRPASYSRSADRQAMRKAIKGAEGHLWTTAELNLWDSASDQAKKVGLIDEGKKVLVTGRQENGRLEIVLKGKSRWVTADYLDDEKPIAGVGGSCTNGTSVASGVSANIVKVHQAVCARFPEITTYGTFRGDGEHSQGIAVDIMVSGSRGWEVAEFIRANYAELGVSYLIYSQKIWSVQRSGEGWRGMSNRGSATANHYDHVHVTTY